MVTIQTADITVPEKLTIALKPHHFIGTSWTNPEKHPITEALKEVLPGVKSIYSYVSTGRINKTIVFNIRDQRSQFLTYDSEAFRADYSLAKAKEFKGKTIVRKLTVLIEEPVAA